MDGRVWARFKDGTTKELEKDCGCLTHNGPHFLHDNRLWKQRNQKLKDRGNYLSILGFVNQEIDRLAEIAYQYKARGIKEILHERPEELAPCGE